MHEKPSHQLLMSWGSGVRRRSVDDTAGMEERDTEARLHSKPAPRPGAEKRATDCRW